MKKLFVLVMCLLLIAVPAMAEEAAGGVTIDLTGVIVAVAAVAFEVLLGWAAKIVVPAVRDWLDERTTESQRKRLYELIEKLVEAAEQVIGRGFGEEKFRYVANELQLRGYEVDTDLIEAAVKEMNDRALLLAGSVLLEEPGEEEPEGVPLDDGGEEGVSYDPDAFE